MAGSQVLGILKDIEADTLRNAMPLPVQRDARPEWPGLGFQLGGVRFVSPLGEVGEILSRPRITRVPRVRDWVLGVANVRGRLVPIIDLSRYIGIASTVPRAQWRVLVVGNDELLVGLLVEQSLGIQHFLEDSFEEGMPDGMEQVHPYVAGAYRQGGRVFYVIHLDRLIADEGFFDVAE